MRASKSGEISRKGGKDDLPDLKEEKGHEGGRGTERPPVALGRVPSRWGGMNGKEQGPQNLQGRKGVRGGGGF